MLTPGLMTPAPVEPDPPRFGFRGDILVGNLGPDPGPDPALADFFFIVAVFGTWELLAIPAVEGAEVYV